MRRLIGTVCVGALAFAGCATTTRTETTYTAASQAGGAGYYARAGRVEQIREVAYQTRGNPAAGAVAGGLIGGLLFGGWGWPEALFGATTGAIIGGAASSGYAESRAYEVLVRFDDGDSGVFTYRDYSPFRPGQRVVLTPEGGLAPAAPGTPPPPQRAPGQVPPSQQQPPPPPEPQPQY